MISELWSAEKFFFASHYNGNMKAKINTKIDYLIFFNSFFFNSKSWIQNTCCARHMYFYVIIVTNICYCKQPQTFTWQQYGKHVDIQNFIYIDALNSETFHYHTCYGGGSLTLQFRSIKYETSVKCELLSGFCCCCLWASHLHALEIDWWWMKHIFIFFFSKEHCFLR